VARDGTYRNVVDSLQSGTVGSLTEGGASSTRFEIGLCVDAFPGGLPAVLDGTSQKVLRTDPCRRLVSFPRLVGRTDLAGRDTLTVATDKVGITTKVAARGAGTGACGERIRRVAAGGRGSGDLGVRNKRYESRECDSWNAWLTYLTGQERDNGVEKGLHGTKQQRVGGLSNANLSRESGQRFGGQDTSLGTKANLLHMSRRDRSVVGRETPTIARRYLRERR
jgi:hypothetical protein